MKRTLVLASTALVALVATSFAVGKGLDGNTKSARAVTGTFTATTASKVETRTCTTTDGKTLVTTNGTYTGTAAGDADLTGAATLRATSLINTTDNIGVVSGTLRIDVASGHNTQAQFDAVYSGGQIAGLATGHAHDPAARLMANVSAGFTGAGGFTNGKIGASAGGAAVELGPGRCQSTKTVKERSQADGLITAVSSTSITVAGLTCAVPTTLQSKVAGLAVGSRAEINCSLVSNVNTLTRVEAKHS
jgi:hypothetical protein